jgi:hypothetical protein
VDPHRCSLPAAGKRGPVTRNWGHAAPQLAAWAPAAGAGAPSPPAMGPPALRLHPSCFMGRPNGMGVGVGCACLKVKRPPPQKLKRRLELELGAISCVNA